jgi:hypothetical protein
MSVADGSESLAADDGSTGDAPSTGDASTTGTTGDAATGDGATGVPNDAAPDVFASCPASRPGAGAIPTAVAQVLTAKCQACHGSPTRNHAPFALLTYADTQAADPLSPYTGDPVWQVMHTVIQPGGVPHMPFGNAPQLTSSEFATLDGWLLACALPQ